MRKDCGSEVDGSCAFDVGRAHFAVCDWFGAKEPLGESVLCRIFVMSVEI